MLNMGNPMRMKDLQDRLSSIDNINLQVPACLSSRSWTRSCKDRFVFRDSLFIRCYLQAISLKVIWNLSPLAFSMIPLVFSGYDGIGN